jgi:hypothetical protein
MRAKLAQLEQIHAGITALTLGDFYFLFQLHVAQRDGVLARLRSEINETRARFQSLNEMMWSEYPDAVNAAWQKDIDAWRAQGGNCD